MPNTSVTNILRDYGIKDSKINSAFWTLIIFIVFIYFQTYKVFPTLQVYWYPSAIYLKIPVVFSTFSSIETSFGNHCYIISRL